MVIGITGMSGSGKTTAGKILQKLGCLSLDLDLTAKEIYQQNSEIKNQVRNFFGDEVFDGKNLNYKRLGEIVFSDSNKLNFLNSIIHPAITKKVKDIINENQDKIIVLDAAAIAKEKEILNICDFLIYIKADKNLLINRLLVRDNLTIEKIEKRLNSQDSDEEYQKNADFVIENTADFSEFEKNLTSVFHKIKDGNL